MYIAILQPVLRLLKMAHQNEVLSVAGARGGEYEADSPGDAYEYTSGDTVNVDAKKYNGIKNYLFPHDAITMLPPQKCGFTLYGQKLGCNGGGKVSVEAMLEELATISPFAYESFTKKAEEVLETSDGLPSILTILLL